MCFITAPDAEAKVKPGVLRLQPHLEWKMWLQGSFLAPVTISSRQMMQTLSDACRSSGVASGYLRAQQQRGEAGLTASIAWL